MILVAILLGAAWRRWFGSARPGWAFPGYRAMQVAAGIGALAFLAGPSWMSLACAGAAIGFMTLPISVSRAPFLWLVNRAPWLPTTDHLPHPWKPMLQGPEPWAEAFQGAALWALAVLVTRAAAWI
jgi:hypothetical protein